MKRYRSVRRALNLKTRQGNRRAERIYLMAKADMMRYRGLNDYRPLESCFGFHIVKFLMKRVSKELIVTEIGGGVGKTLLELMWRIKRTNKNLATFNIELPRIAKPLPKPVAEIQRIEDEKREISELMQRLKIDSDKSGRSIKRLEGDALRVKIPKSDLILSIWSLGYIGHPDFMTKKIAEALKHGGIALLHFNKSKYPAGTMRRWSSFLDRLALTRKLEDCKVIVHKLRADERNFNIGDYFVFIQKS